MSRKYKPFTLKGLDPIRRDIERMKERARKAEVIDRFRLEVQAKLIENIEKQSLDLAELTKKYAAFKRRTGRDPRILISTAGYLGSIYSGRTPKGFFVGVDDKYTTIAKWLELGTRTMPSRPHWRPIIRWAEREWDLIAAKFGENILHGK